MSTDAASTYTPPPLARESLPDAWTFLRDWLRSWDVAGDVRVDPRDARELMDELWPEGAR